MPLPAALLLGVAARAALGYAAKRAAQLGVGHVARTALAQGVKAAGKKAAAKSAKVVTKCPERVSRLVLKPKPEWTPRQLNDFKRKVDALNRADLKVNKRIQRGSSEASKFKKVNGKTGRRSDIDHKQDLQLGGKDDAANMWKLDKSVNRSVGRQIAHQIKKLKHGTRIGKVVLVKRAPK